MAGERHCEIAVELSIHAEVRFEILVRAGGSDRVVAPFGKCVASVGDSGDLGGAAVKRDALFGISLKRPTEAGAVLHRDAFRRGEGIRERITSRGLVAEVAYRDMISASVKLLRDGKIAIAEVVVEGELNAIVVEELAIGVERARGVDSDAAAGGKRDSEVVNIAKVVPGMEFA